MKRLIVVGLALVMLCGCATIKVESPANSKVYLGTNAEQGSVVAKKHVFYALWGLLPISDNSTAMMISGQKEVTVKTYRDVADFLISAVLGIVSVTSHSVEVRSE